MFNEKARQKMKTNYGNTFNHGAGNSLGVSVESLWIRADVFALLGGFVAVDETNTVGKKIPAGTVVELGKPGEAPKFGTAATNPTGLTYEDAYVGTDGCSITVVTNGTINESLSEVAYTSTQKGKLTGINFFKEA